MPKPNDMGGPGLLSIKKKTKKKLSYTHTHHPTSSLEHTTYRPNMRLRLVCSFWWRKVLLSKLDRPKKNAGGNSYFCWPATG